MGSRAGQLTLDKGMQILVSSQIDQCSLETEKAQQELLNYAPVTEGLKENAADIIKDARILFSDGSAMVLNGAGVVSGLSQGEAKGGGCDAT